MSNHTLLSEREKDVLQLVAAGLTNREIAQQLSISPNTVKVHLSNIFEKAGVVSRTEATLFAIEQGYVQVPGGGAAESPQNTSVRGFLKQTIWVWVAILALIGVGLFTVLSNASNQDTVSPGEMSYAEMERWQELTPLPEPRTGMAAVAYDGNIYIIAGRGETEVSGTVYQYLSESDRWIELSEKPTPVSEVQGAIIGEKLYIPGGNLANGEPTDVLEIYDPRRDVWETGSSLPQAVSSYALAAFEGKLFLFGGWEGQKSIASVYIYNPVSDTWREGTPMSIPRYAAGAVAFNDRIAVLGGVNDGSILLLNQTYFPSRDGAGEKPWESNIDLPTELENISTANIFDAVYIFGKDNEQSDDSPIGFTLIDGQWKTLSGTEGILLQDTQIVPMGSVLYVLNSDKSGSTTELWVYQAYYYEIYLPIIP